MLVLPVPAPAMISSGPTAAYSAARRCASLSLPRNAASPNLVSDPANCVAFARTYYEHSGAGSFDRAAAGSFHAGQASHWPARKSFRGGEQRREIIADADQHELHPDADQQEAEYPGHGVNAGLTQEADEQNGAAQHQPGDESGGGDADQNHDIADDDLVVGYLRRAAITTGNRAGAAQRGHGER